MDALLDVLLVACVECLIAFQFLEIVDASTLCGAVRETPPPF